MSTKKEIRLTQSLHQSEKVIQIVFAYDPFLIEKVKQVKGARWSQNLYAWYIPEKVFDRFNFLETLSPFAEIKFQGSGDLPAPTTSPEKKTFALPRGYVEKLQQKRYSEAINLQPADIDSDRMVIKIRGAKGKKRPQRKPTSESGYPPYVTPLFCYPSLGNGTRFTSHLEMARTRKLKND